MTGTIATGLVGKRLLDDHYVLNTTAFGAAKDCLIIAPFSNALLRTSRIRSSSRHLSDKQAGMCVQVEVCLNHQPLPEEISPPSFFQVPTLR